MYVSDAVRQDFENRKAKVLEMILASGIRYEEIGIFGSYAREDYKATSDIDFAVITDVHPDRRVSGSLREDAEELRADIVYVRRCYRRNKGRMCGVSGYHVRRDRRSQPFPRGPRHGNLSG